MGRDLMLWAPTEAMKQPTRRRPGCLASPTPRLVTLLLSGSMCQGFDGCARMFRNVPGCSALVPKGRLRKTKPPIAVTLCHSRVYVERMHRGEYVGLKWCQRRCGVHS